MLRALCSGHGYLPNHHPFLPLFSHRFPILFRCPPLCTMCIIMRFTIKWIYIYISQGQTWLVLSPSLPMTGRRIFTWVNSNLPDMRASQVGCFYKNNLIFYKKAIRKYIYIFYLWTLLGIDIANRTSSDIYFLPRMPLALRIQGWKTKELRLHVTNLSCWVTKHQSLPYVCNFYHV